MLQDDLRAMLDELAGGELWQPDAYATRTAALDRLEMIMLGPPDALAGPAGSAGSMAPDPTVHAGGPVSGDAATLYHQAAATAQRLVDANRALCESLRAAIRSGACRDAEARRTLERLGGCDHAERTRSEDEYDQLDSLVSELLLDVEAPAPTLPQVAERVAYQPAPARVVLELLDRVALGPADLFYDLGAGLGHVCLLVHWLTGAQARGIEIEPAYCRYACQQARSLQLTGVEFFEGDVLEADLADGKCYFLYTPFTGRTLAKALDRLAAEARRRSITLAAYGPCVVDVARQPWLMGLDGQTATGLAIFRSR